MSDEPFVGRMHRLVLPEGVPLDLPLAELPTRAAAFTLDALIQLGLVLVVAGLAGVVGGLGLGTALAQFLVFVVRNLYFVWFEARWAGATPGKRLAGLRVIARDGGPLTPGALVARNLTRELEVFLPLVLLLQPALLGWSAGTAQIAVSSGWLLVLGLLPLCNRDRLRLGDLLGGTLVVRAPSAVVARPGELGPPSAAAWGQGGSWPRRRPGPTTAVTFSPAQLDEYGVRELQVLEDLLRERADDERALETVAAAVRQRIDWRGPPSADLAFLRAFYRAQRERLERDLVLDGRARAAKRDVGEGGG